MGLLIDKRRLCRIILEEANAARALLREAVAYEKPFKHFMHFDQYPSFLDFISTDTWMSNLVGARNVRNPTVLGAVIQGIKGVQKPGKFHTYQTGDDDIYVLAVNPRFPTTERIVYKYDADTGSWDWASVSWEKVGVDKKKPQRGDVFSRLEGKGGLRRDTQRTSASFRLKFPSGTETTVLIELSDGSGMVLFGPSYNFDLDWEAVEGLIAWIDSLPNLTNYGWYEMLNQALAKVPKEDLESGNNVLKGRVNRYY